MKFMHFCEQQEKLETHCCPFCVHWLPIQMPPVQFCEQQSAPEEQACPCIWQALAQTPF